MYEDLQIIDYPDPRLRKMSQPVTVFDQNLKVLAARMLQLMREHKGVGLAAPQVGVNIRMFVMNHNGQEGNDRVYVNPQLSDPNGTETDEEGCLSLPGITADVLRDKALRLDAQDLDGQAVSAVETGYLARVWQHEIDHLNGTLIIDRMGPTAKMACKKKLKELEDAWAKAHPTPAKPARSRR